jgi:hypothetical protein
MAVHKGKDRRQMKRAAIGIVLLVVVFGLAASVAAKTRCADFNADHVVTIEDAYIVAAHFGTYPGSPANDDGNHYSARYDLNGDGMITISDIVLTLLQAGTSCRT